MKLRALRKIHINLLKLKVLKVGEIIIIKLRFIMMNKNIMMKKRKNNMNMKIMVVNKVIKVHCLMRNIYRNIIETLKQIIPISYYNKIVKGLINFKHQTKSKISMARNQRTPTNQKYFKRLSITKKKKNLNKIHSLENMNRLQSSLLKIQNDYKFNQNYLVM